MSPAPLPPHERPWRHPSELAPTKADLEPEAHRYTLPLIVGSAAMLIVAVLVVAVTPSPTGSEQIALTGSTTPARITSRAGSGTAPSGTGKSATTAAGTAAEPTAGTTNSGGGGGGAAASDDDAVIRLAAFTAIPNVVAATPTFHIEDRRYAERLPRAHEYVLVQTELATYRLRWRDVQWLEIDGLAMIADETLAVVGYIDGGYFYPLFDR